MFWLISVTNETLVQILSLFIHQKSPIQFFLRKVWFVRGRFSVYNDYRLCSDETPPPLKMLANVNTLD